MALRGVNNNWVSSSSRYSENFILDECQVNFRKYENLTKYWTNKAFNQLSLPLTPRVTYFLDIYKPSDDILQCKAPFYFSEIQGISRIFPDNWTRQLVFIKCYKRQQLLNLQTFRQKSDRYLFLFGIVRRKFKNL